MNISSVSGATSKLYTSAASSGGTSSAAASMATTDSEGRFDVRI
ncbi:hypothetical protein [Paenibacillus sp. URB8-2]|nr:hypothetical protein [Paenibacillus sp. URB8-2]